MRLGAKVFGAAAVVALAVALLIPAGAPDAASGEAAIKARIHFMEKDIGKDWDVLAAFAKDGKGSLADVEKSASALAETAKKIPDHFPKGTGRGDFPAKQTRALPEIWLDWDGFKKFTAKLTESSMKLASVAKAGDKDAAVALIGKSGKYSRTKIGCAECHEKFRGARVK